MRSVVREEKHGMSRNAPGILVSTNHVSSDAGTVDREEIKPRRIEKKDRRRVGSNPTHYFEHWVHPSVFVCRVGLKTKKKN